LDRWNVHVSHIFMWLPLQLGATYCFMYCLLWLKFYMTCLRWLEQIVVTCDLYDLKINKKNLVVNMQIPCGEMLVYIWWFKHGGIRWEIGEYGLWWEQCFPRCLNQGEVVVQKEGGSFFKVKFIALLIRPIWQWLVY